MIPRHGPSWFSFVLVLAFSSWAQAASFRGNVVGVTDGDTLVVLHDKTPTKVRLYGVDCPEKKQDFGQRAKQFTSERVFGKTVDVRVVSVDRYGRTVGDVILPGGQRLSEELVGAGYAWWYSRYAPKDGRLSQLEAKARREKKGLWSIPEPVPPWEFRRPRAAARR